MRKRGGVMGTTHQHPAIEGTNTLDYGHAHCLQCAVNRVLSPAPVGINLDVTL